MLLDQIVESLPDCNLRWKKQAKLRQEISFIEVALQWAAEQSSHSSKQKQITRGTSNIIEAEMDQVQLEPMTLLQNQQAQMDEMANQLAAQGKLLAQQA